MTTLYPGAIDVFATIPAGTRQADTFSGRTHRQHHNDVADAVEALEAKIGTGTAISGVARLITKTTVAGSAVSSITFSSITADYGTLLLTGFLRSSVAATSDSAYIRLNSDATNLYDWQSHYATNTTVTAAESVTQNHAVFALCAGNTAPTLEPGGFTLVFPGYSSTAFRKVWYSDWTRKTADASGGISTGRHSGGYRQTNAISNVSVALLAGNIAVGSVLTLIGLP